MRLQDFPTQKGHLLLWVGDQYREVSLRAESLIMPGRSLETQIASAGAITGPQREYVTQPLFAEKLV